jgi:parvulin-like peptidyl-prolyl cis-trans isomerase-like protein
MYTKQSCPQYFYIALLMPLVFLSGCGVVDWFKGKCGMGSGSSTPQEMVGSNPMTNIAVNDTSEVLVTINGRRVVTVDSFEREFNILLEENPQLKSVLPFMPDARRNFLTGLVNQEVVDLYVFDNHLDKKIEYQRDLERLHRSVIRMLNTKYFTAAHPIEVNDEAVKAYYEANKDKMQELVVSRGGVQTVGVQFEKESEAKAFFAKAQGKNITDVAKTSNLSDKVRDFKFVNKQSVGIDPDLRNKIVALERLPSTELIKVNDKTHWVVQVTIREETKYRAFEEVKEPLRSVVEREKSNESLQKAIEGLKGDLKVVINDDYFKTKEGAAQQNFDALAQSEQETPAASQEQPAQAATPSRAV